MLTLQGHRFQPAQLVVTAGVKIRITLRNLDPEAEEFDSDELHREKVVAGGAEATVFIGPLAPGTYHFIGETHPNTARGLVIAR